MFMLCLVCGEIKRERSDLLLEIVMWDKKADRDLLSQNEIESHGEALAEYGQLRGTKTLAILMLLQMVFGFSSNVSCMTIFWIGSLSLLYSLFFQC